MRAPGDIVLISCYELGHQPLALAWPAAFLRRAGFAPRCLDLAVDKLDDAALAAIARARLVAISTPMHTALRLGLAVTTLARKANPTAHVCLYGLYAPMNGAVARRAGADTVIGVEHEEALVELAKTLEAEAPAPVMPDGIRRQRLIAPDRTDLPSLDRYSCLVKSGSGGVERACAGYVETTRGCRYSCRHCPIPVLYRGRFFAVPLDVVMEDLRRQVEAGARHITFGDPDFLNAPQHALAVARALAREHPGVTFDATAKVTHLVRHEALLPELGRLGCLFMVSAIESLSDQVLALLAKGHARADVFRALAACRAAGISLRPTFVPFTPLSTLGDLLALCRFIADEDLVGEVDPVQLSLRLLLPPGSLLLKVPELQPHLGALDEAACTYRWVHPDPRMDRLQANIAALVEEAVALGESPAETIARIHELAAAAAGEPAPRWAHGGRRAPPPRLSEPWFC